MNTTHDHDAERAMFGVCLTCSDAGLTGLANEPDPAVQLAFDGDTFDPERDAARLGAQTVRVLAMMRDGLWHSLAEIALATGDPEASISARLRDLRKPRFGAYQIDRRRAGTTDTGWHEYRLKTSPRLSRPDVS